MITEEKLAEFREHVEKCNKDYCAWEDKPLHELLETLSAALKVVSEAKATLACLREHDAHWQCARGLKEALAPFQTPASKDVNEPEEKL